MNPNLVNAIAEAIKDYPQGWCGDHDECVLGMAVHVAPAAIAFVAALPHDYTAADVLAEMRGDAP